MKKVKLISRVVEIYNKVGVPTELQLIRNFDELFKCFNKITAIGATNNLNTMLVKFDGRWYLFQQEDPEQPFYLSEEFALWLMNNIDYEFNSGDEYTLKDVEPKKINYYFADKE